MPRRKRTEHSESGEPGRLSFADLRKIAARRAAMKERAGGVTRRDFVRAGTVAAIAAATSHSVFASAATPDEALNECITEMKKNAKNDKNQTMSFAAGVVSELQDKAIQNFKDNIASWPTLRPKVLKAAAAIGQISAALATMHESRVIERNHVKTAVGIVMQECTALGPEMQRFRYCPSL